MIILHEKTTDLVCYLTPLNGLGLMPKTINKCPCIYVFTYADTRLKIGVTSNLRGRMRDHSTLAPDFTLELVIYFDSLDSAKLAELTALSSAKKYTSALGSSEVFMLCKLPLKALLHDITSQYIDTHITTPQTGKNY